MGRTMPTLMLLRHAKSDQETKLEDHERPLSKRGRHDAPRMGEYMRAQGYEPDLVLCSTSERTRETWNLVGPRLKLQPKVRFDRGLYLAAWPALLAISQGTLADVNALLMIGHNPGVEQLAIALALQPKTPSERVRAETMSKKYPTCALAVLEFDGAWPGIKPGTGRLTAFVRPKDLDEA